MPSYKDKKTGKWYASFYYEKQTGQREKKMKRGFTTKREALEWEREFLMQSSSNLEMKFSSFVEIYIRDMKQRIRETTYLTKESIIRKKILPFFGDMKMSDIAPKDVIRWQNQVMSYRDENGAAYSQTYLKAIHNQLSAIFNHAVRFYGLKENPAAKAGSIGEKNASTVNFWTTEEYKRFSYAIMDKPISYYAFEVLYWGGLRIGEMLALTAADIDLKNKTLNINKSYQRINREDVITPPKTKKSIRTISLSDFLCDELREYMKTLYGLNPEDRIFPITKSFMHHEMTRGSKAAGVKRIKIHELRHSHISHLINLGFSAVAIGDRVGHESVEITYRYAHLFPTKQIEMADKLEDERSDFDDEIIG